MNFKMKNATYDTIKYFLFVFEPALVTLISGLGVALNLDTELVVTIIGLLTTFVGAITQISNNNYNKEKGDK